MPVGAGCVSTGIIRGCMGARHLAIRCGTFQMWLDTAGRRERSAVLACRMQTSDTDVGCGRGMQTRLEVWRDGSHADSFCGRVHYGSTHDTPKELTAVMPDCGFFPCAFCPYLRWLVVDITQQQLLVQVVCVKGVRQRAQGRLRRWCARMVQAVSLKPSCVTHMLYEHMCRVHCLPAVRLGVTSAPC